MTAFTLATDREDPLVFLQRNKPKPTTYPLSYLEPHVRSHIARWNRWYDQRDERLAKLHWQLWHGVPGAEYRYYRSIWTYVHPYYEWPQFWEGERERIRWLHKKAGIIWNDWPRHGQLFNPLLVRQLREYPKLRKYQWGALLIRRSSGSAPQAGAYAVDIQNLSGVASDANDGILDSEGPWATWGRLETALENSTFSVGDMVYLRSGTYAPTGLVEATGGGTTVNSSKITLSGYPGETAMIDWSVNDDRTMLVPGGGADGGSGPFVFDSGNYRVRDLSFTSFEYGFALRANASCPGVEFINLTHVHTGSSPATGNPETLININEGSNSPGYLIEGCDLSDGNLISGNGSTVYVIHTTGVIRNNLIGADTNEGSGQGDGYAVHIKRMNNSSVLGNLTIENNVIGRYTGTGTGCIYYNNTQYGLIQHNCMSSPGSNSKAMAGSDTGEPNNWPWYRNQLLHNTTRRTGANAVGLCGIDNNNAAGNAGTENTVQDNVSDGPISIMPNQNTKTHNNVFNYNLYHTDGNFQEFASSFGTLALWQGATSFMSAPDLDSDEESIAWDTAIDQWDPQTYRLGAGSAGIGSAQDMSDRGADVDLVGPVAIGY